MSLCLQIRTFRFDLERNIIVKFKKQQQHHTKNGNRKIQQSASNNSGHVE